MNEEIPFPVKRKRRTRTSEGYVDNKRFTAEIGEWAKNNRNRELAKCDPLPDYSAFCLMQLTENYAKKSNFRGYTFISDMKSEAITTCVRYMKNFDGDISDNAFGYFSRIIERAFVYIIKKEKIQSELRNSDVSAANIHLDYNNIHLDDSNDTSPF